MMDEEGEDAELENLHVRLKENDPNLNQVEIDGGHRHVTDDASFFMRLSDSIRVNHRISRLSFKNLELRQHETNNAASLLLAPAIKNCTSLRVLQFEECNIPGLTEALNVGLFRHPSIETLHLRGCPTLDPSTTSIGFFLNHATVTELCICHTHVDASMAHAMAVGLKNNTTLRVLDLTGNGINDETIAILAKGIESNSTLEFLSFDFNGFGDEGVAALAKMLSVNSSLRELHLFGNRVSAVGAEHLARALLRNSSLQTLILSFNQIGDRGAAALARALTVNTTLTNLWFPSNSVGNEGIEAFASHLPLMKGLEQLNVGLLLDDEAADALASALKHNLHLSILHMEKPIYFEEEDEGTPSNDMDFYLRLNRSGRRLLRDPKVQPGLWAPILANTVNHANENGVPDVLYYLLREKPELLDRSINASR